MLTKAGRKAVAKSASRTARFDPYKNFKLRLRWEGRVVAGVSKASQLKRSTEAVRHREGDDPSTSRKSPGRSKFEAITLERGLTHDADFERWSNSVRNSASASEAQASLKDFQKDLSLPALRSVLGKVRRHYGKIVGEPPAQVPALLFDRFGLGDAVDLSQFRLRR